jgi:hypothetical protein
MPLISIREFTESTVGIFFADSDEFINSLYDLSSSVLHGFKFIILLSHAQRYITSAVGQRHYNIDKLSEKQMQGA